MTEKQKAYIIYLAKQLGLDVDEYSWRAPARRQYGLTCREGQWGFTKSEASRIIQRLQADGAQ